MAEPRESALSGYLVLDLTQGGCLLCAKLLGDLGADVIKIERLGGDPSRTLGPFYKDHSHPQKSLFWMAYNLNKRGITLNLETAAGQGVFRRLAQKADFVIESFPPGYMEKLGLGYPILSQLNPRLILTSITPFGQSGPKAHYKASDLTSLASGGALYVMGDPDRAPVGCSYIFQASFQGALEAATASLIAHWQREATGEGQQVDVSLQECGIGLLQATVELWDLNRYNYPRSGTRWRFGSGVGRKMVYPCKDGYVAFFVSGGAAGTAASTATLVRWMEEEGMAPQWLKEYDWLRDYDASKITQEEADRLDEPFAKFLLTKTKREIFERGLRDRIIVAPADNMADLCHNPQLKIRDFWVKVPHPELGEELTYPGAFAKFSLTPCRFSRPAPLIGEHNEEVYMGLLGLSREELITLKKEGVI